jgi:hypothetical protein
MNDPIDYRPMARAPMTAPMPPIMGNADAYARPAEPLLAVVAGVADPVAEAAELVVA